MGELKSLIYKKNDVSPSFSIAVLVRFDNYNGSTLYNTDLVPLCPPSLGSCTVENC